jgi:hypothetical protein
MRQRRHEQRVAVGGGPRGRLGGERAVGAGAVLDHELLAQPVGEPLADEARDAVGIAARREADQQTHRPLRPGLRPSGPERTDGPESSGQREKSSTRAHHCFSARRCRCEARTADACATLRS